MLTVPDRPVLVAQLTDNSISLVWTVDTNCLLIDVVLTIAGSNGSNSDGITLISRSDSNKLINTSQVLMTAGWERRATLEKPGNSGSHVWQGLEPYTLYSIRVQGQTRVGRGQVAEHRYTTNETSKHHVVYLYFLYLWHELCLV